MNNSPIKPSISKDEVKKRRSGLHELGLSRKCLKGLRKSTKVLCQSQSAERRMKNLERLGFNPHDFVESNPAILVRTRKYVNRRYHLLQIWLPLFNRNSDLKKLLSSRSQLWSVGHYKAVTIFLLLKHLRRDVIPERICNLITFNLEDILLAYIEGGQSSFMELRLKANKKKGEKPVISLKAKRGIILQKKDNLPGDVFKYYEEHFLQ